VGGEAGEKRLKEEWEEGEGERVVIGVEGG